ncbi:MAG: site-2 protease family protein [Candidatus Riflebacteria bacterium]|nr:site-2 protease family protein [Candidatus Riflebacteria bacterium]
MLAFLYIAVKTIISICFVLVSIALVHELGHYITAKLCGIWVLEFAIGFGNRLFKKQWGETLYSFRPFPLGGFVRLAGMDNTEEETPEGEEPEVDEDLPVVPADHPRSYMTRPAWARIIVLSAGSIMNLVWAIVLFIAIYTISGGPLTNITVIEAAQGKPAYEAGIRSGDIITAIDGVKLKDWGDGISMISNAAHKQVTLSVQRNHPIRKSAAGGAIMREDIAVTDRSYEIHDQETLEFVVSPEGELGSARIGISLQPNNFDFQVLPFSKAVQKGVFDGLNVIEQTIGGLYKMFTRQTQADVAGPVKIMKMIKDQASKGIFDLLYLTAILSVNIGLINLLPLPVLDGGRVVFILLEVLFGIINRISGLKLAITSKVEETVHFVGMIALLGLLVFVTYKDIASFF